jgi:hypothetical protein
MRVCASDLTCGISLLQAETALHEASNRSPSCPPSVGYKGEKGWGLLPNISRGPSPAQMYDARLTKERINYGRLKRL